MRGVYLLLIGVAVVALLGLLIGSTDDSQPNTSTEQTQEAFFPEPSNYVVDAAGVLEPHIVQSLNDDLKNFDSTAQIAVVIVDTTDPLTIEQYGIELAERWGVGDAIEDNGVILILAVGDRDVRIEVGQGVEGEITDAQAGRILDNAMIPHLKSDDWNTAIVAGVHAIKSQLTK